MATTPSAEPRGSPIGRYFRTWYSNARSDLGFRLGIRCVQASLAIMIMVIYSHDLQEFTKAGVHAPASWIYAEVVAGISLIICLWNTFVNANHRVLRLLLDFVIAVLWAAQAGTFGTLYFRTDNKKERPRLADEEHMKTAVRVGIVCMVLWLISFFQSLVWRCQALRKNISEYKKSRKLRKQGVVDMVEVEERGGLVEASSTPASEGIKGEVSPEEDLPAYEESEESRGWADEKRKQTEAVEKLSKLEV